MDDQYSKGWYNSIQYRAEWRRVQYSGSGLGLPLMMLSVIWIASLTGLLFTVQPSVRYEPLIWGYGIGIATGIAGYFLDKHDRRLYNKNLDEFYARWADKIPSEEK